MAVIVLPMPMKMAFVTMKDTCIGELDACGVCNGDNSSCTGCTDSTACNYDADATISDDSLTEDGGVCGGTGIAEGA